MCSESDLPVLDSSDRALRFLVPDEPSSSYTRPRRSGVVIRPRGRFRYVVSITDEPVDTRRAHHAELYRETVTSGPEFRGRCSCKGFAFHAGPCAHLWGLKLAVEHETVELSELSDALDGAPTCPTCGGIPPEAKP
jgi:hypothetical protein